MHKTKLEIAGTESVVRTRRGERGGAGGGGGAKSPMSGMYRTSQIMVLSSKPSLHAYVCWKVVHQPSFIEVPSGVVRVTEPDGQS